MTSFRLVAGLVGSDFDLSPIGEKPERIKTLTLAGPNRR